MMTDCKIVFQEWPNKVSLDLSEVSLDTCFHGNLVFPILLCLIWILCYLFFSLGLDLLCGSFFFPPSLCCMFIFPSERTVYLNSSCSAAAQFCLSPRTRLLYAGVCSSTGAEEGKGLRSGVTLSSESCEACLFLDLPHNNTRLTPHTLSLTHTQRPELTEKTSRRRRHNMDSNGETCTHFPVSRLTHYCPII